jgi:hypothetical protein
MTASSENVVAEGLSVRLVEEGRGNRTVEGESYVTIKACKLTEARAQ